MKYRALGHTGERVSMLGVGGFHLSKPEDPQLAIRIVRTALDNGVNFLDNSWDYAEGESERRMGRALRDGYREKAFLMTKIDGRTAKSAADQLEQSLERLQTDHVDLLQFHEVIRMDEPERIFARGGALEAVLRARSQGKVRFTSPVTRAQRSTSACLRSQTNTNSASIHCRCRSTSWTRTITASSKPCSR